MKLYVMQKDAFIENSYGGGTRAINYEGELYHEFDTDMVEKLRNAIIEANDGITEETLPPKDTSYAEDYIEFIESRGWYCEEVIGEYKLAQTDIIFQSLYKAEAFCKNNPGHFIKVIETQD